VNDQVLMGVLDSVAHTLEQSQALSQRKRVVVAIPIDREAIDVLHDQVRQAVVNTRVTQSGDVTMIEAGKCLDLGFKVSVVILLQEVIAQGLDGHTISEPTISALGEVHDAHASGSDLPNYAVGTDPITGA
jgi:hypothetical protein